MENKNLYMANITDKSAQPVSIMLSQVKLGSLGNYFNVPATTTAYILKDKNNNNFTAEGLQQQLQQLYDLETDAITYSGTATGTTESIDKKISTTSLLNDLYLLSDTKNVDSADSQGNRSFTFSYKDFCNAILEQYDKRTYDNFIRAVSGKDTDNIIVDKNIAKNLNVNSELTETENTYSKLVSRKYMTSYAALKKLSLAGNLDIIETVRQIANIRIISLESGSNIRNIDCTAIDGIGSAGLSLTVKTYKIGSLGTTDWPVITAKSGKVTVNIPADDKNKTIDEENISTATGNYSNVVLSKAAVTGKFSDLEDIGNFKIAADTKTISNDSGIRIASSPYSYTYTDSDSINVVSPRIKIGSSDPEVEPITEAITLAGGDIYLEPIATHKGIIKLKGPTVIENETQVGLKTSIITAKGDQLTVAPEVPDEGLVVVFTNSALSNDRKKIVLICPRDLTQDYTLYFPKALPGGSGTFAIAEQFAAYTEIQDSAETINAIKINGTNYNIGGTAKIAAKYHKQTKNLEFLESSIEEVDE